MWCTNVRGSEFAELSAFIAVATERSFRRAAQRLGMSPSALSHAIRALEARLAARLLNRTTRSVALTEAGQALLSRLVPAMREIDDAVRDVGAFQGVPKGVVRVNLSRIAAQLVVAPALGEFVAAYPGIQVDLVIDDSITDVVGGGFDVGIRSGALVQQDMVAVRVTADLRMAVVGSPRYFAGRTQPHSPDELRDHACVTYRWRETGTLSRWRFARGDEVADVTVHSVLTVNDTNLLLDAALGGVGLAFLAEALVAPYVRRGELVPVLEPWCQSVSGFHLYYPDRSHMPAALRAFIDFFKMSTP